MKKVLVVFGTRPEVVKMALVLRTLWERKDFDLKVGVFSQQLGIQVENFIKDFNIDLKVSDDYKFQISFSDKAIFSSDAPFFQRISNFLTSIKGLLRFWRTLRNDRPDLLLVQGDTNTAMFAALTAFFARVKIGHVEAGLRTYKWFAPFPEEINRRIISAVASIHFAPTENAKNNLLKEGVPSHKIFVTGNTEVDALKYIQNRWDDDERLYPQDWREGNLKRYELDLDPSRRLILVTAHRRESFGKGIENICGALARIAEAHSKDVQIVYPVHPNPKVDIPVRAALTRYPNIYLTRPMDYYDFAFLMTKAHIILTDSGGIQEATSILGKPVLIMREVTERPEAVEAGYAKLVGTNSDRIFEETDKLLRDKAEYSKMAQKKSVYGDGTASNKIAEAMRAYLLK